ncbi:MAG: PEP-CTERM sorting domain-containing protein [Acidobacteriia bacterium]|nr:PEP-CTERM sorting domain-containing protein [Terriglobia bacterium]
MGAPGAGGVVPEPSTFALTAGLLIAGFSARCLRRKNRSREYC